MCSCGAEIETTPHFFLRCQFYNTLRTKLLNSIYDLNPSFRNLTDQHLVELLLFGSKNCETELNKEIIEISISYIKNTK